MAGRIPQAFINDLLDRVDLVALVGDRVQLKKSGKGYQAKCPVPRRRRRLHFRLYLTKVSTTAWGAGRTARLLRS